MTDDLNSDDTQGTAVCGGTGGSRGSVAEPSVGRLEQDCADWASWYDRTVVKMVVGQWGQQQ
ncbi:MAG: hypothetical protein P8J24_00295 [Arenicellales bacterium]|nr:hypothetical protein [Arenicellales bacterium]